MANQESVPGAVPVIVVTGPVGAGKSTVADALQEVLVEHGVTCAAIDQDYLRMVRPTPPDDRFGSRLGYRNLAVIWPNLLEAGVRCVVIADVVEDRAQSLADYGAAMPGSEITIVRLDVPLELIAARLSTRERTPDGLAWSLDRAPELQAIMVQGAVEDILVNVGERSPEEIAREIISRLGVLERTS